MLLLLQIRADVGGHHADFGDRIAQGFLRYAELFGPVGELVGLVDVDSGTVGGAALTLSGGGAISVAQLKAAHEAWLPGYMHQG